MRAALCLGGLFAVFVACAGGPALAAPYDDAFFVRKDATARQMLEDRAVCADEALTLDIDQPGGFSHPDYGVLTAMGAALQQGDMGADVRKAVRRVVLIKCMERRGWTEAMVREDEEKPLRKASLKNPGALDAWLKANEPRPAAVEPVAPPAPPAAPVETPVAATPIPAVAEPASPAPTPTDPPK